MKKVSFLILIITLAGFAPDKPIKTKITEGITVSLPGELKPMNADDIAQRYPSVRAPLGAFTNESRDVTFSVNISATQWPDTNLDMASKFFKSGIYNLYDRISMINEGVTEVHKKKFIFFEFESRIGGTRNTSGTKSGISGYTYIQYLIEPDRAIVFSFNCPQESRQQWQGQALAIMKSVRMK